MESAIININSVKVEPSAVCHGCLSTGRVLKPLQGNTDTFLSLLDHQTIPDCEITHTLLCWECSASLRRFQKFRNRIQNAQRMLRQSLLDHSTPSLSTLSTVKINNEITLQHEEITIKDDKINISNNTVDVIDVDCKDNTVDVKDVDFKDNTVDVKDVDCKDEDVDFKDNTVDVKDVDCKDNTVDVKDVDCKDENTDTENSIEYEYVQYSDEDIKLENNKHHKKKKSANKLNARYKYIKNYTKNAKITVNPEIDLNEPEKYYTKAYLSASEIDELIKKEDKGKSFVKRAFNCKVCKRGYKAAVHLKRHQTFQHPCKNSGSYKCLKCNASFPTQRKLESHWDEHNFVLKCNLCGRLITQKTAMLQHIAYHSNIFTCLVCEMQFNCSRDFGKHYKDLHKRFICDDCGVNFASKNAISGHMRRHHLPQRCIECNKDYQTYKNLRQHYNFCHPSLVEKVTDASLSYCVECDKQFNGLNTYKRHLLTAIAHRRAPSKKLAIPCSGCDKVFSRLASMKNHYKLIHVGKTKHYCSLCDKYFITAQKARAHRQHVHEKLTLPKNKICDMCGRGFSTNRILTHHRRTHTGERPHQCPHCAAAFAQSTALKTHVRTQHKHALNT